MTDDALARELARAKALVQKGAKWQTLLPPQWTVQQREDFMQMAGGLLTGADTYVAYKLLERFVTELERLQEEHEEHEQSFNLFHRASIALMHAYKAAHPDVPDLVLPDTTQVNVWAAAELTRLMRETHHLRTEKRQQLQLLTAIREMADSATGTDRTAGDQREPGALGAVKHLIEQFKARHENVMSSPLASGLLLSLKAECEAQHARAEKAEADLQRLRDGLAALEQEMRDTPDSTSRYWLKRLQSLLTQSNGG